MPDAPPSAPVVPLHPDVEPAAFLLGTWRGEGAGEYPTIEAFRYGEEIRFWHTGKPFLAYQQRTWSLADGRPLHAESGYWRPKPPDRMEVVLAHPTGIAEILEGRMEAAAVELTSRAVVGTTTAKAVTATARTFHVDGDALTYTVAMAAVGQPLRHHLGAVLRRVTAD
jgi:hypothetical protein